jgi:hypothetical protein
VKLSVFRLWYQTDTRTTLRDVVFGAPHKHRLLVGREHGRTIALAATSCEVGPSVAKISNS